MPAWTASYDDLLGATTPKTTKPTPKISAASNIEVTPPVYDHETLFIATEAPITSKNIPATPETIQSAMAAQAAYS